jgi:hypothetical protein
MDNGIGPRPSEILPYDGENSMGCMRDSAYFLGGDNVMSCRARDSPKTGHFTLGQIENFVSGFFHRPNGRSRRWNFLIATRRNAFFSGPTF